MIKGQELHQVRVGHLTSKEEAEKLRETLRSKKISYRLLSRTRSRWLMYWKNFELIKSNAQSALIGTALARFW